MDAPNTTTTVSRLGDVESKWTGPLLALHVSEEDLMKARNLVLGPFRESKFVHSRLFPLLTPLLRPRQQKIGDEFNLQQEWFLHLLHQRSLLAHLLSTAAPQSSTTNAAELEANEEESSLASSLLAVLQTAELSEDLVLKLVECISRKPDEALSSLDFCCSVLEKMLANNGSGGDEVYSQTLETALHLAWKISPLQALRIVPILLQRGSTASFTAALLDHEQLASRSPKQASASSYQDLLDATSGLLMHFPLSAQYGGDVLQSRVGPIKMNVIGDAGKTPGVFSPSSFLALGYDAALNPQETDFSLEIWVSLSHACAGGGIILSSCTQDETSPRGYTLECRRPSGGEDDHAISWEFRLGEYIVMGKTSAGNPTNRAEEGKGENAAFTHVVAVYVAGGKSPGSLSLFLNGSLAQRIALTNRPLVNLDAPLFCGSSGSHLDQFFGMLHDFSFYSCALDAQQIALRWEAATSSLNREQAQAQEEEEFARDGHEDAFRVIRLVEQGLETREADSHCTKEVEQCLVDLFTMLQPTCRIRERALERLLHILLLVTPMPQQRLEPLLIELTSHLLLGEAASTVLATSFCQTLQGSENVPLALAKFLREEDGLVCPDVIYQALMEYTQRPNMVTPLGLSQVLHCLIDVAHQQQERESLSDVIHSALCLQLALGWDLDLPSAQACLNMLCLDKASFVAGPSLDFELCLVELLCRTTFDNAAVAAEAAGDSLPGLIQMTSQMEFDSGLFQRTLEFAPMPTIHKIRIRNKPFERDVMDALGAIFSVLFYHLFARYQISSKKKLVGLALRCMRASWSMIGFLLTNNKHGFTPSEASARVMAACGAMQLRPTTLTEDADPIWFEEANEQEEEDEEEESFKRLVLDSILDLAQRGSEYTESLQSSMRTAHARAKQQTGVLLLLAESQHLLSCAARHWVLTRFSALEPQSLGRDEERTAALKRLLHACFQVGMEKEDDDELLIMLCEKYLDLAPMVAFAHCQARLVAQSPSSSISPRTHRVCFANDALHAYSLPPASSSPLPHFYPNETCVSNALGSSITLPGNAIKAKQLLCTHALYSGRIYFQVRADEACLVHIGLEASNSSSLACGCSLELESGDGIGVLIDMEEAGGMFSVFNLDALLLFACPISNAKRPLTPTFCLLTPGATAHVSFSAPGFSINTKSGEQDPGNSADVFAGPLAVGRFSQPSKLLACGQNEYGELGLGDVKPRKRLTETGKRISALFPCAIAAGNEFSALVNAQGQVYVWGMNTKASCAQDPSSVSRVSMPTLIVGALQSRIVTRLCCQNGSENLFAICGNTGEAFAWGFNRFGNLGLGTLEEVIVQPTRVGGGAELGPIVDVANGYSHTLLLDSNLGLHACGLNSHGQLGLGTVGDIRPFIHPVQQLSKTQVTCIAVGLLHSAVVDASGTAWTFGRNEFGQLGLGANSEEIISLPTKLPENRLVFTRVACGYQFTLLATQDKVFGFGKNDAGQLGLGHTRNMTSVELILAPESRIASLSCGSGHWICATRAGQVFTCGRSKAGATGDGTMANRLLPIELVDVQQHGQGVVIPCQVAAGFHHTLVLMGSLDQQGFDLQQQEKKEGVYEQFVLACCRSRLSANANAVAQACWEWLKWEMAEEKGVARFQGIVHRCALLVSQLDASMPLPSEWLEVCLAQVHQDLVEDENEANVLLNALEWLLALTRSSPPSASTCRRLLFLAAQRTQHDLAVASQALYVLRVWLSQSLLDYSILAQALEDAKLALGVLSVLGGDVEVLRENGRCRVLSASGGGHAAGGRIVWYEPDGPICAKVEMDDGSGSDAYQFVLREVDLIPESRLALQLPPTTPPILEDVFERIVAMAKRGAALDASAMSACKAMCALLQHMPSFVAGFVNKGHVSFLSALLSSNALQAAGVTGGEEDGYEDSSALVAVCQLEKRYVRLLPEQQPSSIVIAAVPQPPPAPLQEEEEPECIAFDLSLLPFTKREEVDAIDFELNCQRRQPDREDDPSLTVFSFEHKTTGVALPLAVAAEARGSWTLLLDIIFHSLPSNEPCELLGGWLLQANGLVTRECTTVSGMTPLLPQTLYRLVFCQTEQGEQLVYANGLRIASTTRPMFAEAEEARMTWLFGAGLDFTLSSLQWRAFASSQEEICVLGKATARGIPMPTRFDHANGLRDACQVPLAWCLRVLERCAGSRIRAKRVLVGARAALLRQARVNAEILASNLGYQLGVCARAMSRTTSLMDAVGLLIDWEDAPVLVSLQRQGAGEERWLLEENHAVSDRKLAEVTASNPDAEGGGELICISDAPPPPSATGENDASENNTFALAATCKPVAIATTGVVKSASSTAKKTATTLEQVQTEIFVLYARRAIVLVLDLDSQNALLRLLLGRHSFLRDYVRAFRFSQPTTFVLDAHLHPANVLRRKLMGIVHREAMECEQHATLAQYDLAHSLADWLEDRNDASPLPQIGDRVWTLVDQDKVVEGILVSPKQMRVLDESMVEADRFQTRAPPKQFIADAALLQSERARVKLECERRAWRESASRSLLQLLLSELASSMPSPPQHHSRQDSCLEPARAFRLVATLAQEAGGGDAIKFYRPQPLVINETSSTCFYSLGDVLEPSARVLLMSASSSAQLAPPLGFTLELELGGVWFWRALPPAGFAALGMVVSSTSAPPALDCMRCVHVSCLTPAPLRAGVFDHQESCQIWTVENESRTFVLKLLLSSEAAEEELLLSVDNDERGREDDDDLDHVLHRYELDQANAPARKEFMRLASEQAQARVVPLRVLVPSGSNNQQRQRRDQGDASATTNVAFWILHLLVDIVPPIWRPRVFSAPLVRALFRVKANTVSSNSLAIRALRALAAISSPTIISAFRQDFDLLRAEADSLLANEVADVAQQLQHSALLCAMMELVAQDEDSAGGENAMREVSSLMDALLLSNDDAQLLPSSAFLLAEDSFLKLARPEDTILIDSARPYLSAPTQGRCTIANAQSLILRFDAHSMTNFGDALALQFDDTDGEEDFLEGTLANCTIQTPGNSVAYRFPVHQQLNWCLSNNLRGRDIKLSNGQLSAVMRKDKEWETCTATRGFRATRGGIHAWEARVDRCTPAANLFFGVTRRAFPDSYVGSNDYSWGFIGCSALWTSGRKLKPFGDRIRTGDVVRVTLDCYRRTLSFAINGVDQGTAFERMSLGDGLLYPAFSFYNKHDAITLLRGSTAV